MMMILLDKPERTISVGVNAAGQARMFSATMSTVEGRRSESESVTIAFDDRGNVMRGDRSAFTTGNPSRLSDDTNRIPLFAKDTAEAKALIREVISACKS